MLAAYGNPVYDVIRTPWVETRGRVLSGCATNAALVYARLGGTVHVTGRSGRDHLADYSAVMALDGIVTQTEPCAQTGGFRLTYDAQGRRDLQVLGVAEPIGAANDAIDDADFVFIGPVMQETPFDLIRDIRHRTDATMLLDPQGLLRRIGKDGFIEHFKPEGIEAICALFDIVKPNELETETLTGIDPRRDLDGAASMLKSWGIPTVVITLAELGSYIGNPNVCHRLDRRRRFVCRRADVCAFGRNQLGRRRSIGHRGVLDDDSVLRPGVLDDALGHGHAVAVGRTGSISTRSLGCLTTESD
jgi:sugar/nucleoside kinase (ribokinase family)